MKQIILRFLFFLLLPWMVAYPLQLHSSQGFTVRFQPQDRKIAALLQKELEEKLPEIKRILGVDTIPFFTVIIAPDKEEFSRLTRNALPSWVEAVTYYHSSTIILKSPTFSRRTIRYLIKTTLHESVHIVLSNNAPILRLPRWLNEGLAVLLTGEFGLREKILLGKASLAGNIHSLTSLEKLLSYQRREAELAYAEAASAVYCLIDIFGEETIPQLLQNIRKNQPFTTSFREATGIDFDDFQLIWRDYITRKYQWLILIDFDKMLWMAFPILVILAFVLIKIKNRRTKKAWQQEEEDELQSI